MPHMICPKCKGACGEHKTIIVEKKDGSREQKVVWEACKRCSGQGAVRSD
ncbi:hypothetical protein ACFOY2_11250 [Nonomuraea purpurea]|uniref:Uncharacterized protein n=1 Tax=Nonomuraea purpurea TaxID=1849276 RepID=A0ABV8G1C7_9ACTN